MFPSSPAPPTPLSNSPVPSFPHKSTLAIHSCPTPTPSRPLFTLFLSLPLAQRISSLLLCSRQIAKLAKGLFGQQLTEKEVARRMSSLEERYDLLRESVEEELEMAWVDAGLLGQPSPMDPSFRDISRKASAGGQLTGVKRKWDGADTHPEPKSNNNKKQKKGKGQAKKLDFEEYAIVNPNCPPDIQPIGQKNGQIPLSNEEEDRMWGWSWGKATIRKNYVAGTDEVRSPNGTTFIHL